MRAYPPHLFFSTSPIPSATFCQADLQKNSSSEGIQYTSDIDNCLLYITGVLDSLWGTVLLETCLTQRCNSIQRFRCESADTTSHQAVLFWWNPRGLRHRQNPWLWCRPLGFHQKSTAWWDMLSADSQLEFMMTLTCSLFIISLSTDYKLANRSMQSISIHY